MRYLILSLLFLSQSMVSQPLVSVSDKKRAEIITNAEDHLGKKYQCREDGNTFDCSGYVKYLMRGIKKNVTRSSVSQIHDGKKVADFNNAKIGDIIIFKGRNPRNNRPGHVGLVHHWSRDTLYFIHASVSKGICIDHFYEPYFNKRFLQIRDVIGK
jgi:cell wall-associated NlpC family hydrolase